MKRKEIAILLLRVAIIILGISLMLSACGGSAALEPSPTNEPGSGSTAEITDIPKISPLPTASGFPVKDENAEHLMYQLSEGSAKEVEAALESILAAEDQRFVGVLIEVMRAIQIGLIPRINYQALIDALEELSGQQLGDSWPAWVEWYGGTDLKPPPGFTTWKGRLLSRIDPGFAVFLNDDHPSRIRVEEIQWGGVLVDGIPALDNPTMISAEGVDYLLPGEPVFGIELNGDARAYPLRIMDWHEMANDLVGGVPISLAYCTLCGAGIAFDGRAADGRTYTFGSSGFLYRSNKLMYDRETKTLWNQLTGEPVLGELAATDLRLEILPLVLTAWADWLAQHPRTKVLSLETGYTRPYELGAAYGDYFSSDGTMFPVWQRSDELPTKARIFALYLDGIPKAYALERLTAEQVVNDSLGQTTLVLVAQRGMVQVEGQNRRVGEVVYDSGGEARAFERGDHTFTPGQEAGILLDENGNAWQLTEEALLGPDGETAPRLGGHLAYWFGWFAFFPNTLIYK